MPVHNLGDGTLLTVRFPTSVRNNFAVLTLLVSGFRRLLPILVAERRISSGTPKNCPYLIASALLILLLFRTLLQRKTLAENVTVLWEDSTSSLV